MFVSSSRPEPTQTCRRTPTETRYCTTLVEELIDRVVAYWAHAGDYFSAGVVSAEQIAEADEVLAGASLRLREIKHKLPSSRAAALEDVIARLRRV